MVFEDSEPLFSRRCVDEKGARFVVESLRQELLRIGWTVVGYFDELGKCPKIRRNAPAGEADRKCDRQHDPSDYADSVERIFR